MKATHTQSMDTHEWIYAQAHIRSLSQHTHTVCCTILGTYTCTAISLDRVHTRISCLKMNTHTQTHMNEHTDTHEWTHNHTWMNTQTHMNEHVHIYMHTRAVTHCIHTHTHTHTHSVHTLTHTLTYRHTWMNTCIYAQTRIQSHTHTLSLYTHTHSHTHAYSHSISHTHTYIHSHTPPHTPPPPHTPRSVGVGCRHRSAAVKVGLVGPYRVLGPRHRVAVPYRVRKCVRAAQDGTEMTVNIGCTW